MHARAEDARAIVRSEGGAVAAAAVLDSLVH
jgi:hypothetical protein